MIREARPSDVEAIIAFTTDTFDWGDYVPSVIDRWIGSTEGQVFVKVDDSDTPIAMARGVFLSRTEVWSHAARVDPVHRGKGLAGEIADAIADWSRENGGHVVRLMIEDVNEPSIRHITKKQYRRTASVVRASRSVGEASPNPAGNGGRANPSPLTAKHAKLPEVPLVRTSWQTGEVGRRLRTMIGDNWRFRVLRDGDIEQAARSGNLWEIGGSWAITERVEPSFDVGLLDTNPDEALDVIRALIDAANERGAEGFAVWLADFDWLVQAARQAGCEVEGYGIWELAL